MTSVKFGLFSMSQVYEEAIETALEAERNGFYSISTNDHYFSPFAAPSDPQLECLTLLTAMAAKTSRIRLVPAVVSTSFRPPPLVAKIASTLDHVSGGRLTLGLGSGWLPGEHLAHGYPFPGIKERLARLDEAIQVIKAMWTEEAPTFRGEFFAIENAYNRPRPLQRPYPPIMLGGSGTGLLRIAAKDADVLNLIPPTGQGKDFPNDPVATRKFDLAVLKERIGLLHRFAREAGRDPDSIELSGLALLGLSRQSDDEGLTAVATSLGFADLESGRRSPVVLLGTPEQVCEELRKRINETGIRYYIVAPTSPESLKLFVDEVMPEFA